MLGLRVLGVLLLVVGALLIGPLATRAGGGQRREEHTADGSLGLRRRVVDAYLGFRKWWYRLVGVLVLIGGVIYIVHPPPHLY
jgi:hypothetical protein